MSERGWPCRGCGEMTEVRETRRGKNPSRPSNQSVAPGMKYLRRRRVCAACGARETTYEVGGDDMELVASAIRDLAGMRDVVGNLGRVIARLQVIPPLGNAVVDHDALEAEE